MFQGGILLPTASEDVTIPNFVVGIFQLLPPTSGLFFELLPNV